MALTTLQHQLKSYTKHLLVLLWIGLVLVSSWKNSQHYLYLKDFSLNQLVLFLFPLIVYIKYPEEKSYRYALPALLCLGIQTMYPHPIFVFFAAGFTIFLVLERHFGKLNELALLTLLLITPTAKYFFDHTTVQNRKSDSQTLF
ncbi:MAG: hypothetical protein ACPGXL_08500 [Chitinophagales bacterium]